MRYIFACLLFFSLRSEAESREVLRFVIPDNPPIGCVDGRYSKPCFHNHFIAWVASKTSFDIEIEVLSRARATRAFFAGEQDLMIMGEQNDFMQNAEPIVSFTSTEFVVISHSSDLQKKRIQDKWVAVLAPVDSTRAHNVLGDFVRKPFKTPAQMVRLFVKQRVDAIVGPRFLLQALLQQYGAINLDGLVLDSWQVKIWLYCSKSNCDEQVKRELISAVNSIPRQDIDELRKSLVDLNTYHQPE